MTILLIGSSSSPWILTLLMSGKPTFVLDAGALDGALGISGCGPPHAVRRTATPATTEHARIRMGKL